jgi:hypothetical protein
MHPMEYYETLRLGREELLRQAEMERLARRAQVKRQRRKFFHLEPYDRLSFKQE